MKKLSLLFLALGFLAAGSLEAVATALVPTKILRSGVTRTASTIDQTNGNRILLTSGDFFEIANPSDSGQTLTVYLTAQKQSNAGYYTNSTGTVAAGARTWFGPVQKSWWADTDGYLQIRYAGNTTSAISPMRLPFGEPESQTK